MKCFQKDNFVFKKILNFFFFQLRKSRSARRSTSITSGMSDRAQSPTKTKTQQGIISDLSFKFHLLKETHCLSDINDSLAKLICHNLGFKTNINFIWKMSHLFKCFCWFTVMHSLISLGSLAILSLQVKNIDLTNTFLIGKFQIIEFFFEIQL